MFDANSMEKSYYFIFIIPKLILSIRRPSNVATGSFTVSKDTQQS